MLRHFTPHLFFSSKCATAASIHAPLPTRLLAATNLRRKCSQSHRLKEVRRGWAHSACHQRKRLKSQVSREVREKKQPLLLLLNMANKTHNCPFSYQLVFCCVLHTVQFISEFRHQFLALERNEAAAALTAISHRVREYQNVLIDTLTLFAVFIYLPLHCSFTLSLDITNISDLWEAQQGFKAKCINLDLSRNPCFTHNASYYCFTRHRKLLKVL